MVLHYDYMHIIKLPIAADLQLQPGVKTTKKLYSICHEDVYNFSIFSCAGWRDVWDGVVNVYYTLFLFMESEVDDGGLGILDMNNPIHVWSLHYVFLARINRDLQDFRYRWNHHGIRTEGNLSPVQLFLIRTMELRNSNLTAIQDMFERVPSRLQPERDNEVTDNGNQVHLPTTVCPLLNQQVQTLQREIDPLGDDSNMGINHYRSVINFIDSQ